MKYAFDIKTLVVVEAESLDEAWDLLPEVAKACVNDFDYELNDEETEDYNK